MRDRVIFDSNEALGASVYLIGSAELDTRRRQLRFDGKAVDVQPKVFDLLAYLVLHRDRVVSKDELFDEVWPSVVVSDASLSQTIKRARDHFRVAGFRDDIIRTVARKGYQFDHPVTVAQASEPEASAAATTPASKAPASKWRIPLLLGGITLLSSLMIFWPPSPEDVSPEESEASANPAHNGIAVLPFANLTPDADFGYFTDGMTETLINNLATMPGLRVIARTSAYRADRSGDDLEAIGRSLNVAQVLRGSVQRDGDMLRISTRLLRTSDGAQLWSRQYSRTLEDIFAVQDDIARSTLEEVSKSVAVNLGAPSTYAVAETAAASRAYQLVLQGNRLRREAGKESVLAAEALFREAQEIAPDYAPALIRLSEVVRYRGVTGSMPRDDAFREALTLAQEAVRLAPENGRAHMQLAELLHRHFWDFAAARESFERAIALMPASGDIYSAYSRFLAKAGDQDEALFSARSASDMDPQSANVLTNLILRLIKEEELEDARRAIERLRELDADHVDLPWLETNWHLRAGNNREALQWITQEELYYLRLSLSAITLYRLERTGQAEEALAELIERDADGSAFQIAEVYAEWGDGDKAFAWLNRALQNGDPGLAESYSSLNLEKLYSDPRFGALAERVGLPPLKSGQK
ncbi:MAG: winged helix-turn-helix domain-containing protein [Pseudomonadota bacterium]